MQSLAPRRGRLVAAAATLILVLLGTTACVAPPATTSAGAACDVESGITIADVTAEAAPRDWVGPSTACLADSGITPIEDDPEQSLPVTVTDNQGTEVTVTDTSRILALDMYGTLAATVFALGLGDSVVGRDTSTGFPEAVDLPLVTQNGHELNGEAILDLAPTVVLTDSTIGPWDVVLQLRDSGIPVVVMTPKRDLDTVEDLVMGVADALGVPATGEKLVEKLTGDIDATVASIQAVAPDEVADRVRVMFLYVRGNAGIYYLFGEGSGADSLIQGIDAVDVAAEIGWQGMRPMTAEALVEAAPDVLIMMTKGLDSVGGIDGLLERIPAVAQTPAGQNRRIVDMADTEIMSFGPRTAAVLDALARAVYAPASSPALVP